MAAETRGDGGDDGQASAQAPEVPHTGPPATAAIEGSAGISGEVDRGAAERLSFFSDAVVAIAITLLAIELPVRTGETDAAFWASVRDESFAYITFSISFVVIAAHWSAHHRVFRWVQRVDQRLVELNLLWLLLIVLNPFLTEVIRAGEDLTTPRFGIYATAQALMLILFALIIARLGSHRMFVAGTPRGLTRRGWVGALINAAAFLVSIPLFPLIHEWAFAVWVLVPILVNRLVVALRWRPEDSD